MIPFTKLLDNINNALNDIAEGSGLSFAVLLDGGYYTPPKRVYNVVPTIIEGVAKVIDSAIVPVNGLSIGTQTAQLEVVVKIDTDNMPAENSFLPVREILSKFASTPSVALIKLEDDTTLADDTTLTDDTKFSVTMYGSQPQAGPLMIRPEVGLSITYSLNIFFSYVQGGINSLDLKISFNGEAVGFTEANIVVTPVVESGALSESSGGARNYPTAYALEISLSAPSLENDAFTQAFAQFLLTKQTVVYPVTVAYAGITSSYNMIFGQGNITASGVNNIGQSITLIEYLEADNGGNV